MTDIKQFAYICHVRKIHRILTVLFALFILLGSTGLRVFTHSCEKDGEFTSYIIKLDDHCEDHEVKLPPCCKKEHKEKDCCSDEEVIYQVDFEYFQDFNLNIPAFIVQPEIKFVQIDQGLATISVKNEKVNRPPPDGKSGWEILLHNQVFRI